MAGTTGEAPDAHRRREGRALDRGARRGRRAARGRQPAPTTPATPATLVERAAATGVDGLLVVAPYYNRPSQAGFEAHFRAVAAATDLPVVLYDIPGRTGRKIDTDVLVRLANEVPTIVGAEGRRRQPRRDRPAGRRARPTTSRSTAATTPMTLPLLAVGAVGVIGTCHPLVRRRSWPS